MGKYEVRLKTGFFETTRYQISISEGFLNLIPIYDSEKSPICIAQKDIISILLLKNRLEEIEIKTIGDTISGVFDQNSDLRKMKQELKRKIHAKIIYKEE